MRTRAGLLVLDFTTLLPGPLLREWRKRAEVIKIDRPGGEEHAPLPTLWYGKSRPCHAEPRNAACAA